MAKIQGPASLETCSASTQTAGSIVWNNWYDGIELGFEISNKQGFLLMTAEWISKNPTYPEPTTYSFNKKDDKICKKNFRETE